MDVSFSVRIYDFGPRQAITGRISMSKISTGVMRKALIAFGLAAALAVPNCVLAQKGKLPDILGLKGQTSTKLAAEWNASLVPATRAGEFVLRISVKIPPGHHVYSTTKNVGEETKINVARADGLEPTEDAFVADREPEVENDANLGIVQKFHDHVTWTRNYRAAAGATAENISVAGLVKYQMCDDQNCRLEKYEFDVQSTATAIPDRSTNASEKPDAETAARAPDDAPRSFEQMVGPRNAQRVGGTWMVSVAPSQARKRGEVTLTVEASLEPGWHVYALDQGQTADGEGPLPTVISVTGSGLIPIDAAFTGPAPKIKPSEGFTGLDERYHEGRVQWTRRYRISENAAQGTVSVVGKVAWQMCNSGGCLNSTGFEFQGSVKVADEENSAAMPLHVMGKLEGAAAVIDELRAVKTALTLSPPAAVPNGRSTKPVIKPTKSGGLNKSQGLPLFLVAAVLAGFAALLTPCVFPMIPITVSFFQKQSEKQHHRPITMALVYCLGIVGTFTALGMLMSILFSATAIQQLASNWIVNLFIAGVLVFFSFNLMGMFEIQMPSWLLTYTAGKESRGGFFGVLFMALTFTLTSFTCTFAFAGGLLAAAANGDWLWPTLGLLAFSAAFSLPFFFLALFPSMLQKLPKSGGLMNLVKVVMGLIELGAAFKFFGNVDTTWNGQPAIFDFHLMISAWAVISIAAAMYLLGVFRLPHDTPVDSIGVLRFVFAMSFLGLASYLGVGLFASDKPHGVVWRYVEAFANPNFEGGADPSGPWLKHGGLKYALDLERAFETAKAENKPLFLDFTGVTCTNCRYMEKGPMSQPDIEQRLGQFVRVQLYTDSVPIDDKIEAERLLEYNLRIQGQWFGDVTLPSYVIIPPDRSVLDDSSKIISALVGKKDQSVFAQFLDSSLDSWKKVQAQQSAPVVGKR